MIGWLGKLWAKLAGWLAAAGTLIIAGAYLFWRGKRSQRSEDAAQTAQGSLQASRDVGSATAKAVARVAQEAAQAQAPDVVKRDDFDSTR